jgi:TPR repeat protein
VTGCVYIITNKNNQNLVKIGCTSKTASERAKQFNQNAGMIYPCVAEYELQVTHNHELLEQKVHKLLSPKWEKKEWFKCSIEQALEIIRRASNEFSVIGEVFYWVERAKIEANHGIADAQTKLAYAYYKGYGVSQDYKQAKELFEKSANQGDAKAQNYLGLMYQNKQGIEETDVESSESRNLLDDTIEQHDLEHINFSNEHIIKAKECFEKSAEQNNSDAQFNLGCMYYESSWLAKDYKKSLELFKKSAEQGNANAQLYLGKMYQYGNGVKLDTRQAENWYLKAIESDDKLIKNVIETCLGKKPF